jgi:hypothetical protein
VLLSGTVSAQGAAPLGLGATPTFGAVGATTANATLETTHQIAYPAGVGAGDLLLCIAVGRSSAATLAMHASMSGAGWAHLTGSPFGSASTTCLLLAWRLAVGGESGNIPGGIIGTGTGTPAFVGCCVRFDAADGFAAAVFESISSAVESNNVTTSALTVTPTDGNRLAVSIFGGNNDPTTFAFTGATGGTWATAAHLATALGSQACINLQTVDLSGGLPISGGSATMSTAAGGHVVAFALVPTGTGGGGNGGGGAPVVGAFYPQYGSTIVTHAAVPWTELNEIYFFGCSWRSDYTTSLNLTTDEFTRAGGHPFTNGQAIQLNNFSGSATPVHSGGSLAYDTNYFARDVTATTFKLALTSGGAALNFTDAGVSNGRRFKAPAAYINRNEFEPPIDAAAVTSIVAQRNSQNPSCQIYLSLGRDSSMVPLKTAMDYGGAVGSRAGLPDIIAGTRAIFDEGFDGIVTDIETMSVTGVDGLGDDGQFVYDLHEALRAEFPGVPIDSFFTRSGPANTKEVLAAAMVTEGFIDSVQVNGYALAFPGITDDAVWHHGALNHNQSDFGTPTGDTAVGQIETIAQYTGAGVPINKIKIGLQAGGVPWVGGDMTSPAGSVDHGARFPLDGWAGGVAPVADPEVTYRDFLAGALAQTGSDVDDLAVAFFAWKTNASPALELFWSSENAATAATKRAYWEGQGLGGLFLWQLAGDDASFSIIGAMGPPAP